MVSIKLKTDKLRRLVGEPEPHFPKYATQIMNLANQNAQGTRPRVVGQMSDLIQEFSGKSLAEWEAWYLEQKPEGIEENTRRVAAMIDGLRASIDQITKEMVREWIRDLIVVKTFLGMRFQQAILHHLSQAAGQPLKLATPAEEAKGIDGTIGGVPVSIQPDTYRQKHAALPEVIDVRVVYYAKHKDGIVVTFEPWW